MVLLPEVEAHFGIEGASGLLQAEIVVETFVGEIACLETHGITPMSESEGGVEVVRKLGRHDVFALVGTETRGVEREAVEILRVVSE